MTIPPRNSQTRPRSLDRAEARLRLPERAAREARKAAGLPDHEGLVWLERPDGMAFREEVGSDAYKNLIKNGAIEVPPPDGAA